MNLFGAIALSAKPESEWPFYKVVGGWHSVGEVGQMTARWCNMDCDKIMLMFSNGEEYSFDMKLVEEVK